MLCTNTHINSIYRDMCYCQHMDAENFKHCTEFEWFARKHSNLYIQAWRTFDSPWTVIIVEWLMWLDSLHIYSIWRICMLSVYISLLRPLLLFSLSLSPDLSISSHLDCAFWLLNSCFYLGTNYTSVAGFYFSFTVRCICVVYNMYIDVHWAWRLIKVYRNVNNSFFLYTAFLFI